MKFTNSDLAKAMGLKIGDRVKVKSAVNDSAVYELDSSYCLSGNHIHIHLDSIIELDYEILPKKKKVGELLCKDVDCDTCPLRTLHCDAAYSDTLYKILERHFAEIGIKDKEIYNILKARLDKEMKE